MDELEILKKKKQSLKSVNFQIQEVIRGLIDQKAKLIDIQFFIDDLIEKLIIEIEELENNIGVKENEKKHE